jgi:hypothetical protein
MVMLLCINWVATVCLLVGFLGSERGIESWFLRRVGALVYLRRGRRGESTFLTVIKAFLVAAISISVQRSVSAVREGSFIVMWGWLVFIAICAAVLPLIGRRLARINVAKEFRRARIISRRMLRFKGE